MGKIVSLMVALVFVAGCVGGAKKFEVTKVAILGNSITLHGAAPQIGWEGNWGMAASSADKDFAHILLRYFTEANGGRVPEMLIDNVGAFERNFGEMDPMELASIRKTLEMKPDVFILGIGENTPNQETDEARALFLAKVVNLLELVRDECHSLIVVRSTFWPREWIDSLLKQACEAVGGVYVDIHYLCREEMFARSEREYQHDGVAVHPGDKGMQAIADAIWTAIQGK